MEKRLGYCTVSKFHSLNFRIFLIIVYMSEYFWVTVVSIIQVEAEDPDSGSNGDVTYSFSSGASPRIAEMFSIDPTTGVITVKKSLEQSGRWDF